MSTITVPAVCETQLAGRSTDARLAVIIDLLLRQLGISPAGATLSRGIAGLPFTSADASAAAPITDAPAAVTEKLTIIAVEVSVGSNLAITLKEETSGTVIAGPYYMLANTSKTITFDPNKQLPTANKKLTLTASGAGNVMALATYFSS